MPKTLTIGVDDFEFPQVGDNPDYGEQVTDWATAVTEALTVISQPNDILRTTAVIANGQSSFVPISGFLFDTTQVRSINSEYLIRRITTLPEANLVESGFIQGLYDGSTWTFNVECVGNAGVEFNITNGGQLEYKSTFMDGAGYEGQIVFRAKVFNE